MSAYVIVDMVVTDPAKYADYRPLAEESVRASGGRYLARGGATEVLEGDRTPNRIVILEFPTSAAARSWYEGEDYRRARAARAGGAAGSFVVVEGITEPSP